MSRMNIRKINEHLQRTSDHVVITVLKNLRKHFPDILISYSWLDFGFILFLKKFHLQMEVTQTN